MSKRSKKTAAKGEGGSGRAPTIVNRKARHDYHIVESMEAGIALSGAEVKSIREGKISLQDAYARIKKGEVWLIGLHISPYKNLNTFEAYNPERDRKLLLHKRQIAKLAATVSEKGLTLLPLKIYFTRGLAKLELGVGKGKKLYDKREDLKRKEAQREMERALKK